MPSPSDFEHRVRADGLRECNSCPQPATRVSRPTANRDLAYYCDFCADRSVGWPERTHAITEAEARP